MSWKASDSAYKKARLTFAVALGIVLVGVTMITQQASQPSDALASTSDDRNSKAYFSVPEGEFFQVRGACIRKGGDLASLRDAVRDSNAHFASLSLYARPCRKKRRQPQKNARTLLKLVRRPTRGVRAGDDQGSSSRLPSDCAVQFVAVGNALGTNWQTIGLSNDRHPGICKRISDRKIVNSCKTIHDCKLCMNSKESDSKDDICVPVLHNENGTTCETLKNYKLFDARIDSKCRSRFEDTAAVMNLVASYAEAPTSYGLQRCISADWTFEASRQYNVMVTPCFTDVTIRDNDEISRKEPVTAWIDGLARENFTACIQKTDSRGLRNANSYFDRRLQASYFAFTDTPFKGSQTGSVRFSAGTSDSECKQVAFSASFTTKPRVIDSAQYVAPPKSPNLITSWWKELSPSGGSLCIGLEKGQKLQADAVVLYIAWSTVPDMIMDGTATISDWKWNNQRQQSRCAVVPFDSYWIDPPIIQASVREIKATPSDQINPLTTWVEGIENDKFKVCVQELADRASYRGHHDAVEVDWIAVNENTCPMGQYLVPGTIAHFYLLPADTQDLSQTWPKDPYLSFPIDKINIDNKMLQSMLNFDATQQKVGVRIQAIISIRTEGSYMFRMYSREYATLTLDGSTLIENSPRRRVENVEIFLTSGIHVLQIRWMTAFRNDNVLSLSWRGRDTRNGMHYFVGSHCSLPPKENSRPALGHGFSLSFIETSDTSVGIQNIRRLPAFSQMTVPYIQFETVEDMQALQSASNLDFSGKCSGIIYVVHEGDYMFQVEYNMKSDLWIDSTLLTRDSNTMHLARGYHYVENIVFNLKQSKKWTLKWQGPDTKGALVVLEGFHIIAVQQGITAKFYDLNSTHDRIPHDVLYNLVPFSNTAILKTIQMSSIYDFQSVDPSMSDGYTAVTIKGSLYIQQGGSYTFYLTSIDGAKFWIDGAIVINLEGKHYRRTVNGNSMLQSGMHTFHVTYWIMKDRAYLNLRYRGPDTNNYVRDLPSLNFSDVDIESNTNHGFVLSMFFFDKNLSSLPITKGKKANHVVSTRYIHFRDEMDFKDLAADWPSESGVYFHATGILHIREPGKYSFVTAGLSSVMVDGEETLSTSANTIVLDKGYRVVRVAGYSNGYEKAFSLEYSGPDTLGKAKLLRASDFIRPAIANTVVYTGDRWCSKWYLTSSVYGNWYNSDFDKDRSSLVTAKSSSLDSPIVYQLEEAMVPSRRRVLSGRFRGTLSIKQAGRYEFCLNSHGTIRLDGGLILNYIGSSQPNLRCRTVMCKQKDYEVRLLITSRYGEKMSFKATYNGPDTGGMATMIPSSGFDHSNCRPPPAQCDCGRGWCIKWYLNFSFTPDFMSNPVRASKSSALNLDLGRTAGENLHFEHLSHVLVVATGIKYIQKPGIHSFCIESASKVKFNFGAAPNLQFIYPGGLKKCESVELAPGAYDMSLEVTQLYVTSKLVVSHMGPGDSEYKDLKSNWQGIDHCGQDPNMVTFPKVEEPKPEQTPEPKPEPTIVIPPLSVIDACLPYIQTNSSESFQACGKANCKIAKKSSDTKCQFVNAEDICYDLDGQKYCSRNQNKDERCHRASKKRLQKFCEQFVQPLHLTYYCQRYAQKKRAWDLKFCKVDNCRHSRTEGGCAYVNKDGFCYRSDAQQFCSKGGDVRCRPFVLDSFNSINECDRVAHPVFKNLASPTSNGFGEGYMVEFARLNPSAAQ
eukprot:749521-Hanusia_phi.AAC.1